MGSLVFGAAGGYLFGPLGFLIGTAAYNLLFPQKQEGPRLSDLHTQTSAYGEMIPIIYGKIRLPGKVIWADELREHKHKSGGKGGPEVTTYTYTCSFASYLCEGPIVDVKRIWADKQLIWNTDDANSPDLPFTLYYGDTTQTADPTMEAILGVGNVPGYRRIAYIVFEDLELADYANRIPDLEFEVLQAGGPIPWRVSTFTPDSDTGGLRGATFDGDTGIITIDRYYASGGEQYRQRHYDIYGNATGVDVDAACPANVTIPSTNSKHVFGTVAGHFDQNNILFENAVVQTNILNAFGGDEDNAAIGSGMMVVDDVLYVVGFAGTFGPVGVASYPLSDNVPAAIPAGAFFVGYDPSFSPSNLKVIPSNDGFIWFYYNHGGADNVTLYKCNTTTLDLVHQWDPGDLPSGVSFLSHSYSYGIYNNLLVYNDGSNVVVYRITGTTFTLVGSIPQILGPCIPLGAGLFLGTDGVISVIPPEDAVTLGDIVGDLSSTRRAGLDGSQYDVTDLTDIVPGYKIGNQSSCLDCISPLQNAWPFDAVESGAVMKFVRRGHASVVTIPADDLAAYESGGQAPAPVSGKRALEQELPREVAVRYFNLGADYLDGQQYERRLLTNSTTEVALDLPIAMSDTFAKSVATVYLYGAWYARRTFKFSTSYKYAYLEPTDIVTIGSDSMRITKKQEGANGVIAWEAVADDPSLWVRSSAAAGGVGMGSGSIASHDPSVLVMLDIPLISDSDGFGGYAAMYPSTGATKWSARLFKSVDGGTTYTEVDGTATADVVGTAAGRGPWYGGNTFDEATVLTVTIGPGGGELESVSRDSVLAGQNEALYGTEIIGTRDWTLIAPGVYEGTGHLRGRCGTEWAMNYGIDGEQFVKLPTSINLAGDSSELYVPILYKAVTKGTSVSSATAVEFTNTANALKPYSPVEVAGGLTTADAVRLEWTRRARTHGAWLPLVDVPISEATEQYVVQLWDSSYTICAAIYIVDAVQSVTVTAADIVTLYGAAQHDIFYSVGQMGSAGLGSQGYGSAPAGGSSNNAPLVPIAPYVYVPAIPPPGPTAPVDYAMTWPLWSEVIPNAIGDRTVMSFTTGGSIPLTGTIGIVEAVDGPTFRHCFIATDTGGVNKVAHSESYGVSVTSFIGSGTGGAILAASTTYYFIFDYVQPDGSFSGAPGTSARCLVSLGNVT